MEQSISYVVQVWDDRYEYWCNTAQAAENMFSLPAVYFETEEEGRAKLNEKRELYPTVKYRLARVTCTTEEI